MKTMSNQAGWEACEGNYGSHGTNRNTQDAAFLNAPNLYNYPTQDLYKEVREKITCRIPQSHNNGKTEQARAYPAYCKFEEVEPNTYQAPPDRQLKRQGKKVRRAPTKVSRLQALLATRELVARLLIRSGVHPNPGPPGGQWVAATESPQLRLATTPATSAKVSRKHRHAGQKARGVCQADLNIGRSYCCNGCEIWVKPHRLVGPTVDKAYKCILRALLIIGGIHPNPGPTSLMTFNVRGPVITVDRWKAVASALRKMAPTVVVLTEFKTVGSLSPYVIVARLEGYHLSIQDGIAFMADMRTHPKPVVLTTTLAGRIVHGVVNIPQPTNVYGVYGSNGAGRPAILRALKGLQAGIAIGDFNAVTSRDDTRNMTAPPVWKALKELEDNGDFVDLHALMSNNPKHTRVRAYHGTSSRIDRAYAVNKFSLSLYPVWAEVVEIKNPDHLSDHDCLSLHWNSHSDEITKPPYTTRWRKKDFGKFTENITLYMATYKPNGDAWDNVRRISSKMVTVMNMINQEKKPIPKRQPPTWETHVRELNARQTRRRFFTSCREELGIPTPRHQVKPPYKEIAASIPTGNPGWHQMAGPNPHTFTRDEIKAMLTKNPRKAPGPDGLPPCLLSHLPNEALDWLVEAINYSVTTGRVPDWVLHSNTWLILKKDKPSNQPESWRPISLTNSVYRVITRAILSRVVHCAPSRHQYGFLPGRTTAQATFALLSHISNTTDAAVIYVDIQKAFDSLPHKHIRAAVEKYAATWSALVVSLYCKTSTSFIGSDFSASPATGIRQGCPLSPTLFAWAFSTFLEHLDHCNLKFVAYADDVAIVTSSSQVLEVLDLVERLLREIGLRINRSKIVVWKPSDRTVSWHLGHAIGEAALSEISARLAQAVRKVDALPLVPAARVKLLNVVVMSKVAYAAECLKLNGEDKYSLRRMDDIVRKCIFNVSGLPRIISPKTIYGKHPVGLGLRKLDILVPTRILNAAERCKHLSGAPYAHAAYVAAAKMLEASVYSGATPATRNSRPLPPPHNMVGAPAVTEDWYTDGSKMGMSATCAAVTISGTTITARPYGRPCIYKAELTGVALAITHCRVGTTIRTDSRGAVVAINSSKSRVNNASLINYIRMYMFAKNVSIQ
eukprot:TRINITY_DN2499_c0_g1_i4.p1 TRINITY_DN2499_c0_g1~~TRINITY_DN2499_c0_g1_i4.p1  ORF type:complete len:1126 (-),score=72.75 TRINITY_DN2499_c0_g1_i4:1045-4422(-)